MGDSLRKTFEDLVKKYEAVKAESCDDSGSLLDDLVGELYQEAADYWYSSSAEC